MPTFQRPCLRPDLTIATSETSAALEIWTKGLRVGYFAAGEPGQELFEVLTKQLDGRHAMDDITAACLAQGHTPEDVTQLLDELHKRGIIFDAGKQTLSEVLLAQYRWWGCFTDDPAALQQRLAQRNLVIAGDAWISEITARAARESGLRPQIAAFPSNEGTTWQAHWQSADFLLIVLAGDLSEGSRLAEFNNRLIEHHIPALLLKVSGSVVRLGPLVVPSQTVCLAPDCIGQERITPSPNQSLPTLGSPAVPMPFILGVVHRSIAIAMDFLAQIQPSPWLNQVEYIDWRSGTNRQYTLLKNPRCPACSRLQHIPEGRSIDA